MFRNPVRPTPLVSDIADLHLRLPVQAADAAMSRDLNIRLPMFRIQ